VSGKIHIQAAKPEAPTHVGAHSAVLLAERLFRRAQDDVKNNETSSREQSCFGTSFSPDNPNPGHNLGRISIHPLCAAGIQPKLKISEPNDSYEQEADRVADTVMRMSEPAIQRQSKSEEDENNETKEEKIQAKPVADQITPLVQRQSENSVEEKEEDEEETVQPKSVIQRQAESDEEKEEPVQAKAILGWSASLVQRQRENSAEKKEDTSIQAKSLHANMATRSRHLEAELDIMRGQGEPLPGSARAFFERRFGHDFGQVRIHADGQAARSANNISAQAFTRKEDIFFGNGRYQPHTAPGRQLLAHELTHVVQQASPLNTTHLPQPDRHLAASPASPNSNNKVISKIPITRAALVNTASLIQKAPLLRGKGALVPIRKGIQELGKEEKETPESIEPSPKDTALSYITYDPSGYGTIVIKFKGEPFLMVNMSTASSIDAIELRTSFSEASGELKIDIKATKGVYLKGVFDKPERFEAVGIKKFDLNMPVSEEGLRLIEGHCEDKITLIVDGISEKVPRCITPPPEQIPAAAKEEEGVLEGLGKGALLGDFIEDPTIWNVIGQVVVGFIPYAGQAADLRDTVASLKKIIFEGGWKSGWEWANLVLTLIGWVPGLGDAIKAGGKSLIKFLKNFFKTFGGIGPFLVKHLDELKKLGQELLTAAKKHLLEPAVKFIREVADSVRKKADELAEAAGKYYNEIKGVVGKKLEEGRKRIEKIKSRIFPQRNPPIADPTLPPGAGHTDRFGNVTYSSAGSATDQALVRYHEQVHSILSPRLSFGRNIRADLMELAYHRSAFLKYLEEALAESYAQLRVHGIRNLPDGIRFPIKYGYVTLRAVVTEAAIGTVLFGGVTYGVYVWVSQDTAAETP